MTTGLRIESMLKSHEAKQEKQQLERQPVRYNKNLLDSRASGSLKLEDANP
jgi:hypothetical protein